MTSAAAVLACALVLLGRPAGTLPAVGFLDRPPHDVSFNAEAFVRRSPDTIYLITSSAVFRAAQAAQPSCSNRQANVKLASVLAHELWHLKNGDDEAGAYAAQLTTLVWLGEGTNSALFSEVRGSMRAVLDARMRVSRTRDKRRPVALRP